MIGYFLILIALLSATSFIRCTGEWCGLTPFGWAFAFWGNVLLSVSPHWYWSLESFPGFGIFIFALNLFTVYGLGALIERWYLQQQ